ncbi:MAG: photosystem II cytochrome c-550 [Synechococcales cyanobacterium]
MVSKSLVGQMWQKVIALTCVVVMVIGWQMAPALAIPKVNPESPEARTVAFTETQSITFTPDELTRGKKLFNTACAQCHVGGASYTNPDVGLKLEELELATPRRDNVLAIVDYVKNPTTYDGSESLVEYHPNTQLKGEYPKLRNLSDEDLKVIAGFILYEANNLPGWGGTKSDTHSDMSKYLS